MGVYDDVKTAIEKVVAPDLGEIKARLSAVEKKIDEVDGRSEKRDQEITRVMEHRLQELEAHMDRGNQELAARMDRGSQELAGRMERGFDRVSEQIGNLSRQVRVEEELRDVVQRLAAVESKLKDQNPQQPRQ